MTTTNEQTSLNVIGARFTPVVVRPDRNVIRQSQERNSSLTAISRQRRSLKFTVGPTDVKGREMPGQRKGLREAGGKVPSAGPAPPRSVPGLLSGAAAIPESGETAGRAICGPGIPY